MDGYQLGYLENHLIFEETKKIPKQGHFFKRPILIYFYKKMEDMFQYWGSGKMKRRHFERSVI